MSPDPPTARRPLVIAHRGSSDVRPEHTLDAYVRAISEGVDGLECDVRLTRDGELVCLHDRSLERTGGMDGIVSTMTLAQLRAIDWGAWRHRETGAARVEGDGDLVTLRELVALALDAPHPIGLAIETKHPTRSGGRVELAVAAILREFGLTGPHVDGEPWARMMSFSQLAVRRMRYLLPNLNTVQLLTASEVRPYRRGALLGGAETAGLDIAIVRRRPEIVAAQQDNGHEVFVWTVDEDTDIELCLELGVDAIISNRPRRVLDAAGISG